MRASRSSARSKRSPPSTHPNSGTGAAGCSTTSAATSTTSLLLPSAEVINRLLTFFLEDVVLNRDWLSMLATQLRHLNKNLANQYLESDYIVTQADWGTTSAPDAAPSPTTGPSQPDNDEGGLNCLGKKPATEEENVDIPSRSSTGLTTPTRQPKRSRTVRPAIPISTLSLVTRGMKHKLTDQAPQANKQ